MPPVNKDRGFNWSHREQPGERSTHSESILIHNCLPVSIRIAESLIHQIQIGESFWRVGICRRGMQKGHVAIFENVGPPIYFCMNDTE